MCASILKASWNLLQLLNETLVRSVCCCLFRFSADFDVLYSSLQYTYSIPMLFYEKSGMIVSWLTATNKTVLTKS